MDVTVTIFKSTSCCPSLTSSCHPDAHVQGILFGCMPYPWQNQHHGRHGFRFVCCFPPRYGFSDAFFFKFPSPQGVSWIMCRLHKKTLGKIFSMLQTTTSTRAWWTQTTNKGTVIGNIGVNLFGPISTRSFKTWLTQSKLPSSKLLPSGSDKARSDKAIRSELAQFRMRFRPSERPSNWLATPTPYTNHTLASLTSAFDDNSKPSDG